MKAQKIKEAMQKCQKKITITITLLFLSIYLAIYLANVYLLKAGESPFDVNYYNLLILFGIITTLNPLIFNSFEKVLTSLLADEDQDESRIKK